MSTIKSKVSIQVAGQQPDFVQSDHPDFLASLKAYYEFLESAELQLTTLGSVDSLSLEASAGANSLLLQENLNIILHNVYLFQFLFNFSDIL